MGSAAMAGMMEAQSQEAAMVSDEQSMMTMQTEETQSVEGGAMTRADMAMQTAEAQLKKMGDIQNM